MPIALLDGDSDLGLRPRFQFAHLCLLMFGEFGEAVRRLQVAQGEAPGHLVPHILDPAFLGHDEQRGCCEAAQAAALGSLALVDAGDEVRDGLDTRADGAAS